MTKRFIKKKLGQVPEPLGVMWHNRPVLKAFFRSPAKPVKWNACDSQLKSLAHMAAVSMVGLARIGRLYTVGARRAGVCRGDKPDATGGD
jgi:hypothetical protein